MKIAEVLLKRTSVHFPPLPSIPLKTKSLKHRSSQKQRKDDNTIEEIVLLVNDDESFICMAIKGSINEDELRSLVAKFANKSKINVNPV